MATNAKVLLITRSGRTIPYVGENAFVNAAKDDALIFDGTATLVITTAHECDHLCARIGCDLRNERLLEAAHGSH